MAATARGLDAARSDRAAGVLLGLACGDALGAGYEFGTAWPGDEPPAMIGGGLGGFAPGEWTDDTSMAVVIAEVAAGGADLRTDAARDEIARGFRRWYDASPPDIGIQTAHVLAAAGPTPTAGSLTAAAATLHARTGRTAGNGSLMRTAPVALAHLGDPVALVDAARQVSALTHADARAGEACALWCLAIRHAFFTGELDVRAGLPLLGDAAAYWSARLDEAEDRDPGAFTPNGWVVSALQAAWSAIHHTRHHGGPHDRDHLDAALERVIRIGDDTDTTAAIAGALLGARYGASAVPARWREVLHGWPGLRAVDLTRMAVLAAGGGLPDRQGWPGIPRLDYRGADDVLVRHPHDDGVWLASAPALDRLPGEVTAVVSLCRVGAAQVPAGLRHLDFRLVDRTLADNPNLAFVLDDAAATVERWRNQGEVVVLHCVAAQSRTPTVAARYAARRGVDPDEALRAVCAALPGAAPNPVLVHALGQL